MAIEWNRYLARYQQERGGYFFGNGDSCWDGYLVLAEGEKTPLLVWFDTEFTGGSSRDVLRARTMVWLDGDVTHPGQERGGGGGSERDGSRGRRYGVWIS